MSAALEANKALVRRFFEAISHDGDLAALDDLCIPGYAHRVGGEPHSLAWLKDIVSQQFRVGFPDVRFAVEDLIAEGDKVWARWTLQGTHSGEFQGHPATGKPIRIEDCFNLFRVANGKLVEDIVCWGCEYGELIRQIGGEHPE